MAYTIQFAESVKEQVRSLRPHQRVAVLESMEKQLLHEPLTETRSRKLLRPNPLAPWELRIGSLRVFYEVDPDEPDVVRILAVGEKKGSKLLIADKEVPL
jgi:mRNA-degrading endonuclease RelE of RelBE toxin-antitoxin system